MRFFHDDAIWSRHPGLRALVVAADDIGGLAVDPMRAIALTERVEARLAAAAESEMPEIAAWREAFSRMGLKPTQYRCASEALLRRWRKERSLPTLHPLVDHLNLVSMAFAVPIAAFDREKIAVDLHVRAATGAETYHAFGGETETPNPGETIFADGAGVAHARRWAHRQSALSAVGSQTRRVLIVAEAHHADAAADLARLVDEVAADLEGAGARIVGRALLGPDERVFTL